MHGIAGRTAFAPDGSLGQDLIRHGCRRATFPSQGKAFGAVINKLSLKE